MGNTSADMVFNSEEALLVRLVATRIFNSWVICILQGLNNDSVPVGL